MTPANSLQGLIYCDEYLLVVNKPAGLLAVPGRGEDKQDCLSKRVQQHYPDALIVHRLDMATSGLILFARGIAMQRLLSKMFSDRIVTKRYVAVVAGSIFQESGEVNLPVGADWPNRPRQKVDMTEGKPSLTRYRVLSRDADSTRLELEPVTGRTHQLRVHMNAIGYPIVGDNLYDGPAADRLMLHAGSINLPHPHHNAPLAFNCPAAF